MTFPQTIIASQANKETPISEMFVDLTWAALGSHNPATTTGLTFGVNGGTKLIDGVLTTIADQTTLLDASTTNYVEWTRAGVLSDNPTGFTAGREPLYVVTTSASGVVSFVDSRTWGNHPGMAGRTSVAVTTADVTLTAAQARCEIINATGALTGNRAIIVPNGPQTWCVTNNTTGAFTLTVKTASGSGVVVTQSKAADVLADGTNVILSNNDVASAGGVTSVDASGGVQTVAGTPITTTGTIRAAELFNAQTGTTYTFLTGDRGKLVTFANAAAIAATLPVASGTFPDGWFCDAQCAGVGTVTITPTTSTINGAATLALSTGQSARIVSDGTNYRALIGVGTPVANDLIWDAAGDLIYGTGANAGTRLPIGTALQLLRVNAGATAPEWVTFLALWEKQIACSDYNITAIEVGACAYFRAPRAITLTSVRASLATAQASGAIFTVDVKKNGTTIFSTLLTIDNTEKTSVTAATPAVLSSTTFADDDEIVVEVTQVTGTVAKGLIVTFIGA